MIVTKLKLSIFGWFCLFVDSSLCTCMKYFASLDADLSPPRSREKALEAEILEEIFGGGW